MNKLKFNKPVSSLKVASTTNLHNLIKNNDKKQYFSMFEQVYSESQNNQWIIFLWLTYIN